MIIETLAEIDIFTLPSVPLADKNLLPDSSGLYFVASGADVLYVGKAQNSFKVRWSSHHRLQQLLKVDNTKIFYKELLCSKKELKVLEDAAILRFKPTLNESRVPDAERRDRFQVAIPPITQAKLVLMARQSGISRTKLIEDIVNDYARNQFKRQDFLLQQLRIEAQFAGLSLKDFVNQIVKNEIPDPVDASYDWTFLLKELE